MVLVVTARSVSVACKVASGIRRGFGSLRIKNKGTRVYVEDVSPGKVLNSLQRAAFDGGANRLDLRAV